MYGWMGTILRVDLSTGAITKEPLREDLRRKYIGGRGINVRLLWEEVKRGTDGFAPENRLVFGCGPLTGTMVASGRINVSAMSPLTQLLGDSNGGSHFSPEMKSAGYDHIVFTGKADKPMYLWVDDDHVQIRDASHLWGKLTDQTQDLIREELGDPRIQVSCIGPAGENLVRLANIMIGPDGSCGRCGLGAVMGSKNLKAVAVRGTKDIKIADPKAFRDIALDFRQRLLRHPAYPAFSKYGTTLSFERREKMGMLTMKNAQESGRMPSSEPLNGTSMYNYVLRNKACFGCAMHCRRWFQINDGPFAGLTGTAPEVFAQETWGSLNSNTNAPSIYKLFTLCNQYGLDQGEAGQLVALATEWYEKELITKEDLGGLVLGWGNYRAMIALLHKIVYREGIGDTLAEDAVRAARKLGKGAEKCFTHSKGVLKTNIELRAAPTYAFSHAVATRGADHLRGATPSAIPPGEYEGVAKEAYQNNLICTIADLMEICKFHTSMALMPLGLKEIGELFSAATGIKMDEASLKLTADRIWTLERAFIVREGITKKDDVLVGRSMDEAVPSGPFAGMRFERDKWEEMLDEYYELVGWDKATGAPTRAKLEEVGLQDIMDAL